jgi:ubiquinone/menaquinone biosynthesis C-methylase UbiE
MSDLYLRVREKEGRFYPDTIVAGLPHVPRSHPYSNEWRSRAESCSRLTKYLATLKRPLSILELGCGNGWLSHRLSLIPATRVWGLDRSSSELVQAARIFHRSNLNFLSADIFSPPFSAHTFDEIILASVIQYFPDLTRLIVTLQILLHPGGEIHVLDSPIYLPEEIPTARERSRVYYASLGLPEMGEHYFHHSFTELVEFAPNWYYRPDSRIAQIQRLLGLNPSPFAWLIIR